IAEDAFIHHFGHRTFSAAGVYLGALLQRNQQLFQEKWASEATTPRAEPGPTSEPVSASPAAPEARAASAAPIPAPRVRYTLAPAAGRGLRLVPDTGRLKLSLAMIVRDNEG